jgi:hypothetical protein
MKDDEPCVELNEIIYRINQTRLMSSIIIHPDQKDNYEIQIYHKAFSQDTSLLTRFLKNPHEETIEDKASCKGMSVC